MEKIIVIGEGALRTLIAEEISRVIGSGAVHRPDSLLTVEEVAGWLQVHPGHVYRIKDKIGFIKQGSAVRFKRSDVDRFINSNKS